MKGNCNGGKTLCLGTSSFLWGCRFMPRYFFHLSDHLPAHDLVGHECINEEEARKHGSFIAHRRDRKTRDGTLFPVSAAETN